MNETPGIALGTPGIMTQRQIVYEHTNRMVPCFGTGADILEIRNWSTVQGRCFTEDEILGAKKVALIGKTIADDLFPNDTPVGKTIRINKIPFLIIGLLSEKGRRADGADEDNVILAPYTTVQRRLLNITDGLTLMLFSLKDRSQMSQTTETIRSILRYKKKVAENDDDPFTIFNQDEIARTSQAATTALNILLLIIASISLIVGGIGIMNIMLVTVTERTKEIGLRIALGATKNSILTQFLVESTIVCVLGGIVGMLLGVAIALSVGSFLGWNITISTSAIGISFITSTAIGIFFGFYPAQKASQMNPTEALLDR
jgi:putative ABC transport system permease protein